LGRGGRVVAETDISSDTGASQSNFLTMVVLPAPAGPERISIRGELEE